MKTLIVLLTLATLAFSIDKWEYSIIIFEPGNWSLNEIGNESSKYSFNLKDSEIEESSILYKKYKDTLNMMGTDGWELVSTDNYNAETPADLGMYLHFKRKLQ